jgi:hypothetical protein
MKGALEDHLGRIIHPDTEGDQVILQNGKNAEEMISQILAKFAGYLPLSGGALSGYLSTDKTITVNQWCGISAGTDGTVLIAQNAYKHPTNNTIHFSRTHESMGARGIVMQNGQPGIWYFDTGSRATAADEQFTPTLISMTDKRTVDVSGTDLNFLHLNGIYNGVGMINAPTIDWYWVHVTNHNLDSSKWVLQEVFSFGSTRAWRRVCSNGVWSAWDEMLTQSNAPAQYYATWEPLATDGKDGDVWDVYV